MSGRWRARGKWVPIGSVAVAGALVAGIVLAGRGEPVHDVRLMSGAAWLPSSKVGQVTLLDGSTAEVAAQVQVASAGTSLDVAQQGSTAYAIDQSAGLVRRVDGATFDTGPPTEPIPDTKSGLTVIPGPGVLYVLDSKRGVLATTDPKTLTRRGDLITLASEMPSGSATVDNKGQLWTVDAKTGDLSHVTDGQPIRRPGVAQPGQSVVVISDGTPVVADLTGRKLIPVDPLTARPGTPITLDLRSSDTVQVSGSAHSDRSYLMVSRGVLTICALSAGKCDTTIPLTSGNEYGPAVEAAGRVFVPDYTTGEVLIIDPVAARVLAKSAVLTPSTRFQLLARDSVVFYNDTQSERAGVVHLDGSVLKADKYNPKDPQSGLSGSQHSSAQTPSAVPSGVPAQGTVPNQPGNQPTDVPVVNTSRPPPQPGRPTPPPPPPPPGQPGPNTPQPPEKPDLEITVSKATPVENEPVTLTVHDKKGGTIEDVKWSFGDGGEATAVTTTHQWAKAQATPYLVSVNVRMRDNPDTFPSSVNITVSEEPKVRLTVEITAAGGSVAGGGLACPGPCFVDVKPNTQVELKATPDGDHLLGTWGGACGGTSGTCDVTLKANEPQKATYAFKEKPPETWPLDITPPDGGSIAVDGKGTCPAACHFEIVKGLAVGLTARDGSRNFAEWTSGCSGTDPRCASLVMNGPKTVTARYIAKPWLNSLSCNPVGGGSFQCTADAGPPEYYDSIRWVIDGIGRVHPSPTFKTNCSGRDFDVTFSLVQGMSKTTTVHNCT
ncbi:PKD domain-containing protein [Actinocrispum sp. NPDC049592]|uniref:PKD domain-containing protein n=1 Tax=Actinocrispum sp. NPDC049592 TaxID=3154835 RepID=UPI003412324D